ncbi:GNAT family N-acetyltransferase [Dyella ginsengisoli]|uniref:GNAT family N-acetyltransferase n=1 Tax=Dyella ginsengisoli TaxID=363848 RepID=UPI000348E11A|nr:GNAT family N-acetyltransferase [Dyella ginsengisoli]
MNAAPSSPAYTIEPARLPGDAADIVRIWGVSRLGRPEAHRPKIDWFYQQCPFGEPTVCLLRDQASGERVGVSSAGPRRMVAGGRVLEAGVLVDFAVHPKHRSLGPAMILQAALMEASAGRFDLLYGVPNPKSLAVVKRLGYAVLGEMRRHARVLRSRRYLARRMPGWLAALAALPVDAAVALTLFARSAWTRSLTAGWSDRVDPRMDVLWQASRLGDTALAARDCVFLRWRFDAWPMVATRYLLVSARDGTLHAWFACQVEGGVLHVRDFWSAGAIDGVPRACLDLLLHAAWREGLAAVSMECMATAACHAAWQQAGFRERGRRPVIGRWQRGFAAGTPPALHLTAADEDQ